VVVRLETKRIINIFLLRSQRCQKQYTFCKETSCHDCSLRSYAMNAIVIMLEILSVWWLNVFVFYEDICSRGWADKVKPSLFIRVYWAPPGILLGNRRQKYF